MNDEYDSLFGVQAAKADPPDQAPPAPAEPPATVRIPLFKPGTKVSYQGQYCTVSYVTVRRGLLLVKLDEIHEPVDSDKLYLEPTCLTLKRR